MCALQRLLVHVFKVEVLPRTCLRTTSFWVRKLHVLSLQEGFCLSYRSKDKTEILMSKPKRRSYTSHSGGAKEKKTESNLHGHLQEKNVFLKKQVPPFEELWSKEKVQEGLKRGTLFQGSLTISHKRAEFSFVTNPTGGPDFFLSSIHARNRALQDDIVVVQPLDAVDGIIPDISSLSLKEVPSSSPISSTPTDVVTPPVTMAHSDCIREPSAATTKETLVDRLYSIGGGRVVKNDRTDHAGKERKLEKQRNAKVVYITEKIHNRACVGKIKAFHKDKGEALLCPGDYRMPRVLVPLLELPQDLAKDFKRYDSASFVCHIHDWLPHSVFPSGHVKRSLGEAGLVEAESETILIDQQIDFAEFSKEVEDCLPKNLPWTIPAEEMVRRRDFRKECVLTVDPETARDLDDALHIKKLSEDVFEVGVHIADVSFFVPPGTALDRTAGKRATSTYLVHKVIPMLPRLLCEQLCSLNPNEDKLSFSVVWQLSSTGEFISQWIGRSIIRSCCKLSYGDAQAMIDGEWSEEALPPISGGVPVGRVVESIVSLNKLAVALRKQRRSKGTLQLNQPKLHYLLNEETGMPFGCEVYPIRPSNRMIEEFMLLANMTVARRLLEKFPQGAMLRRHPSPRTSVLLELAENCAKLGFKLDVTSADSIQRCLDGYQGQGGPQREVWEKRVLVVMAVKAMELARYFSTDIPVGVDTRHYALNVPLYTHFTSPIRRYADLVVHRQLAHALNEGPPFTPSPEEVEEQAVQCNKKKKSAKIAGDTSIDLFFSILLKETGPQTYQGMVMSVLDKSFDVMLKEFGLVRRVHCEQMDCDFKYEGGEDRPPSLKLFWSDKTSTDKASPVIVQTIKVFSEVSIVLSAPSKNILQNKAVIVPPTGK